MTNEPTRRGGLGIALILVMGACFATMDNSTKYLGAVLPVLLIMWFRYLTQAALMGVWLLRAPNAGFKAVHPRFQALRGALLLACSATTFYGVQYMPVAEFTAINMLTPVLVTLLSARFFNESVSPLRWVLVCGGFAGALIVIRPGSGLFGWAVIFPLAGALSYSSFQVLTSRLAGTENPFTTHFYTGLTGMLLLTPFLLLAPFDVTAVWHAASVAQLGLLLAIGLLGTLGHLLLILALGLAPSSTLMPFIYVQIGSAAVVSAWMFGTQPDAWGWIGMSVIALCGAASAWLNVRRARHPVKLDPMVD